MKKFIISLLVGFIFIFSGSLITFYEFKDINLENIKENNQLKTNVFKEDLNINELNPNTEIIYIDLEDRIDEKQIKMIEDNNITRGTIQVEVEYYQEYVDNCYIYHYSRDFDQDAEVTISVQCSEEFDHVYEFARDLFKTKRIPNRLKSVTIYINPKDRHKVELLKDK